MAEPRSDPAPSSGEPAYVEPIVKKLGAYQKAGGKFIVPLPEVKVL